MPYADSVDAEPVRIHVKELISEGMTIPQIQYASGIDRTIIRVLIGLSGNRPPSRQVRRDTAERLLRVRVNRGSTIGGLVPSIGTRRRLQALQRLGWTLIYVNQRLGHNTRHVQMARSDVVEARNALDVMELYDELSDREGPSQRTRERSIEKGFLGPDWWDDETIDDPHYVPPTQVYRLPGAGTWRSWSEDLDELAIRAAMAGRPPAGLTPLERDEAIRRLREQGRSSAEIGTLFGLSGDAIFKIELRQGGPGKRPVLVDDYALPRAVRVDLLIRRGFTIDEIAERIGTRRRYVLRDLLREQDEAQSRAAS